MKQEEDSNPKSNGVDVILPAGGLGQRMGEPKQFLDLGGQPLFQYSLDFFSKISGVGKIALVLPPDKLNYYKSIKGQFPKLVLAEGGAERANSVRNGFLALDSVAEIIFIHDVARPFLSMATVRDCLQVASGGRAAIAALPAVDTIKKTVGRKIGETLDRRELVTVQTPQAFPRVMLEKICEKKKGIPASHLTDEAGVAEFLGFEVEWVVGSPLAKKITEKEDLRWAEWILSRIDKETIEL